MTNQNQIIKLENQTCTSNKIIIEQKEGGLGRHKTKQSDTRK